MSKLEDFIQKHKEEFDTEIPTPEMWNRIENELNHKKVRTLSFWKVAASVAAVITIALISSLYIQINSNKINSYANISDPALLELLETEAFYARKVSGYLQEINDCYKIYPELKNDLESDLNELDYMYKELKNDLNDNFYNREVIEAMIQNNRTRIEMFDRVLNQINC